MSDVRLRDKVNRDGATANQDKVKLGDMPPAFRAGDKVIRDGATANQGTVRLGDMAPVFAPKK